MPAKKAGPIRVGILGQGRSGLSIHANWLSRSTRKYKIVAVSDLIAARRRRAEAELGCQTYADYDKLLARGDLDLVVNSLPSHLHPQVTVEALERGHHVVCEKPLAWSAAHVDRMIAAAGGARRRLVPFQQSRFAPHFQKILAVIDSGVLGRIVQINIAINGFARRWDWQTLQEFRGGNLLNTGPHPMDQAMRLLDFKKPQQILCQMDRANTFGDAEDHVKILMRSKGAPAVDVEISSCCAYPKDMYQVFATQGGLSGGPAGLRWRYYKPAATASQKLVRAPLPGPSYCGETLKFTEKSWAPNKEQKNAFSYMSKCFYDHLYQVLRQGAQPQITPRQVRSQIAVIEECHRQNRLTKLPGRGWTRGRS